MATQVTIVTSCDKCGNVIEDPETDRVGLKVERTDAPSEVKDIDLHQGCVDTLYLPDEYAAPTKRKRRTKAQMEAARAAGTVRHRRPVRETA